MDYLLITLLITLLLYGYYELKGLTLYKNVENSTKITKIHNSYA